ncbi:MAG: hypothetical protein KA279_05105 [Neisseria sp.]|nr:hypothetical protein [Neisseria sp.]
MLFSRPSENKQRAFSDGQTFRRPNLQTAKPSDGQTFRRPNLQTAKPSDGQTFRRPNFMKKNQAR